MGRFPPMRPESRSEALPWGEEIGAPVKKMEVNAWVERLGTPKCVLSLRSEILPRKIFNFMVLFFYAKK